MDTKRRKGEARRSSWRRRTVVGSGRAKIHKKKRGPKIRRTPVSSGIGAVARRLKIRDDFKTD
jgi:hypothetical protein